MAALGLKWHFSGFPVPKGVTVADQDCTYRDSCAIVYTANVATAVVNSVPGAQDIVGLTLARVDVSVFAVMG